MTKSMEKMFIVSRQEPGGAKVAITRKEVSADHLTMMFTARVIPGTKVEVKFQGEHVAGSPFTYQAPSPAGSLSPSVEDEEEAVVGLRRMELIQRTIADVETNVRKPANIEVKKKVSVANTAGTKMMINKEAPSTSAKPSTPLVVDLSSDSSNPASAAGIIDFSAGVWREVDAISRTELGGQIGLCLLKNGNLVVSTMENRETGVCHVKMFDPQLKLLKPILDQDGKEFRGPGDMTRLYNGDFALKVFLVLL